MNILIIGNPNSIWIKNFVKYSLSGNKRYYIDILCTNEILNKWKDEYCDLNVKIIEFPRYLLELRGRKNKTVLEKVYSIDLCAKFVRDLGEYDVINMQFVGAVSLWFLWRIKDLDKKLIISYWGSDLLRLSKKDDRIEKIFLKCKGYAYATFDNGDLESVFYQKFGFARRKGKVVMFGLPVLDCIDETRTEDCKTIYEKEITEEKIVISIGYNGGNQQRHLKVIKQLSQIKEKYRDRIIVVLQMTYGGTDEYKKLCVKKCVDAKLDYILFEEFQDEREIAKLRKSVDIFVNAQTTDAFSGSFCEYMYANTIVLNAKWLHYRELDEYPFVLKEFERFEDIPSFIETAIDEIDEKGHYIKIGMNRELIQKLRSCENSKKQWNHIFNYVIKNSGYRNRI